MTDGDTVPDTITRYALPVTEGQLVFFHIGDEGIAPGADAVSYRRNGRLVVLPYARILEVNLGMAEQGKGSAFATMQIRFARKHRVLVTSTDAWLRATPERVQEYYRFKADLHGRLVAANAAHIRFTTGYTPARANVVKVVLAIALGFFTLLPLVLFFLTGQAQALWVMLVGLAFVVPFVRAGQRNMPASYDPRDPPDMLA
jgi:hypothetical protein